MKIYSMFTRKLQIPVKFFYYNTFHPFNFTAAASLFGLGADLYQSKSKIQIQVISYNSCV